MDRPKLFIGSSKERLPVAWLVQELLATDTRPRVWDQGLFGLSKTAIASLLKILDGFDAAVFILAPDDLATIKSDGVTVTRDNVIFELGLFMGRLGPERTFMLSPQHDQSFHLPTDLLGVATARYDATAKGEDIFHSLGPACNQVRRALSAALSNEPSYTLQHFLESTNFSDVSSISIVAYTGSSTIRTICEYLEREPDRYQSPMKLRVALRSPLLSDAQRAGDIRRSRDLLDTLARNKRWIEPEIRYYGAPPLLRSVLLDLKDGTRSAYLSYYDWSRPGASIRRPTTNQQASHALLDLTSRKISTVHQSWFSHFWAIREIHTIIFDFDDTLFATSRARIEAWRETVLEAVNRGIEEAVFTQEVRGVLGSSDLSVALKQIFFDEQDDVRIAARIFLDPNAKNLDWSKSFRTKRRAELTNILAQPLPGLIEALQVLACDFQLGIVTGTDETSVKSVLRKHGLLDQFAFILGREAPNQPWAAVEVKTQNLLRAANFLGIPLDRIIFVGDDDADYNSAKQLGMHFVENRAVALANGRSTLIRVATETDHQSISGFESNEIGEAINAISLAHDWHG